MAHCAARMCLPPKDTTLHADYTRCFERVLAVQATRRGETGMRVPPVTGKLPSVAAIKAKQAASHGYDAPHLSEQDGGVRQRQYATSSNKKQQQQLCCGPSLTCRTCVAGAQVLLKHVWVGWQNACAYFTLSCAV